VLPPRRASRALRSFLLSLPRLFSTTSYSSSFSLPSVQQRATLLAQQSLQTSSSSPPSAQNTQPPAVSLEAVKDLVLALRDDMRLTAPPVTIAEAPEPKGLGRDVCGEVGRGRIQADGVLSP